MQNAGRGMALAGGQSGNSGTSWPPGEPGAARSGDITNVDLLEQQLVPVIFRIERAQGLLVGAPRGWHVTQGVVATAENECRERECGVGIERAAKRGHG